MLSGQIRPTAKNIPVTGVLAVVPSGARRPGGGSSMSRASATRSRASSNCAMVYSPITPIQCNRQMTGQCPSRGGGGCSATKTICPPLTSIHRTVDPSCATRSLLVSLHLTWTMRFGLANRTRRGTNHTSQRAREREALINHCPESLRLIG